MKHIKIIFFLFVLTFTISCGQQKTYVQYKVKRGETMSSIARNLNLPTQDLLRLNPDVTSLKADSYIVVPKKNLENFESNNKTVEPSKKEEKNPVKEEVKEKELPKDKKQELIVKEVKNDTLEAFYKGYITYKVKQGDTFFGLTRALQMTKYELLSLNPFLKVGGLKTDQILRVKKVEEEVITNINSTYYQDNIEKGIQLKAALLLPFNANKYPLDSTSAKTLFTKNATLLNIATDFYLGAQIAVDSLRAQGVGITLNVYDAGDRTTNKISSLLASKNLNNVDVLIGPMFSEQLVEIAPKVNTPVVFPVYSKNQSEFTYSNIIKSAAEKSEYRKKLENYIVDTFEGGTVLIISDGKTESTLEATALKNALEFKGKIKEVFIVKGENGNVSKASIINKLLPNKQNWIILASEQNIAISSTVNSLISLPENTTAKLFAIDKGAVYDQVDNKKLAQLGFTYVTDSFKNSDATQPDSFEAMFFKANHTVPSFYATKGFDITYDILMRLASGNKLEKTFKQGISYRSETLFNYSNNRVSENIGLFILQYKPDLTQEKLR